ncbi:MAG: hypothetical protein HY738_21455 [Bacteroidia bacterium]|nr:hypothetical protein [Bacteroidia bacterium]
MKTADKWNGQSKARAKGIKIFMVLIKRFGIIPAYILLSFVALKYIFNRDLRKQLTTFRNKLSKKTTIWQIYRHIFSLGTCMIDRFIVRIKKKSPFMFTCTGEEHIINALSEKKGLILLSAHIGNQEIGGDILFEHIKTRINFLQFDNEKVEIKNVIHQFTHERAINVIPTNSEPIDIMLNVKKALENNEIVCMLGDRVMGDESHIKLNFLGKQARFPTYPFEVAALTGAPIIIATTLKTGLYSYIQKAYRYLPFNNITRPNRKQYIRETMKKYVTILEDIVHEHPYQWFNFYDFWDEL